MGSLNYKIKKTREENVYTGMEFRIT